MTRRRTYTALGLALLLAAAGACGTHPTGRSSLATLPHRAGSAPIAAGIPAPHITGAPIYEDFAVDATDIETDWLLCTWQRGLGDIIVSVSFTLEHTGGIPGHQPTAVNLHLVDDAGHRSPTYTSGFTNAYFGIHEPIGTAERLIKIRAVLDLGAPDSDPRDDISHQAFVYVPSGVPVGFAPHSLLCSDAPLF